MTGFLMIRLLLGALIAVSVGVGAQARTPVAERLAKDIRTLSSDAFEGRGPATGGEQKTITYLQAEMRAAGLKPGGDRVKGVRSWLQRVPLRRATFEHASPSILLTLAGQQRRLAQGDEIALRPALTGKEQVKIANAPLVFVGYGIDAPERSWNDFTGIDVKGKILVVLINDPDVDGEQGDFGGRAMTYYGRWTYKFEEAARQGAAGVLIVHETKPATYGWNTVKNSMTGPVFDIVRKDPASAHTPFEAWVQRDVAAEIFKVSGLDFEVERKRAQTRAFKPLTLNAVLSADLHMKSEVITSHNVVGILPGTSRAGEFVMYTAHWDHLGVGKPDASGDRIYNGAVDNAAGTAQLLEVARTFVVGPRPQRSVLFLAVTGEENGLLGSEYYAANSLYSLAKTAGVINMDASVAAGPTRDFSVAGDVKSGLLDDLIALAAARQRTYSADAQPEAGKFFRSDHFSLAKRGVPAISFEAGSDLEDGGTARGLALVSEYIRNRYHQPGDEWSDDWDLRGMVNDVGLLHDFGFGLANSRKWPNWRDDSEFRHIRDQTARVRR